MYDDPPLIQQWCRCGIICDSEYSSEKFLLEVTPNGIEETNLSSRLLRLKQEGKVIGYKPLNRNFIFTES